MPNSKNADKVEKNTISTESASARTGSNSAVKKFNNMLKYKSIQESLFRAGFELRKFDDEIQQIINHSGHVPYEMNEKLIELIKSAKKARLVPITIQALLISDLNQGNWPKIIHAIVSKISINDDKLGKIMNVCIPKISRHNTHFPVFKNVIAYVNKSIEENNIDPHDALVMLSIPLISPRHICEDELRKLEELIKKRTGKVDIIVHGKGKESNQNTPNPPDEHMEFSEWYALLRKVRSLRSKFIHHMHNNILGK